MSKFELALPLVLAAAAASCGGEEKQVVMVPASSMAPRSTPKAASDRIADARCNYEASCNKIGPGGNFESRKLCEQTMRADAAEELGTDECMDGVADRHLNACLAEIGAEECGSVTGSFDRLGSFSACKTSSICLN